MPYLQSEVLKDCPYDPNHKVSESRFQVHLVKCRRSHPDTDKVVCSWNSCHVVPEIELEEHERNCLDSIKFVKLKSPVHSSVGSSSVDRWNLENQTEGHDRGVDYQEEEEDWGKEANVKESYNPMRATENKILVRKIEGATPAQRKEFRKKERERIQKLEEDQEMMKLLETSRNPPFPVKLVIKEEATKVAGGVSEDFKKMNIGKGRGRITWGKKATI